MEKQVILAASIEGGKPYFSVWTFGKRVIGCRNPYSAIKEPRDDPYRNEKLSKSDFPLLLQPLIQWSE